MSYTVPTFLNETQWEFFQSTGLYEQYIERLIEAEVLALQMHAFAEILFSLGVLCIGLGICYNMFLWVEYQLAKRIGKFEIKEVKEE